MAIHRVNHFPILLDLEGKRVVVVGGGEVAERKVRALVDCGAQVTVVAPELTTGLARLAAEGGISHDAREYRPSDLDGAALAFIAVNDPEVSAAAAKDAKAAGPVTDYDSAKCSDTERYARYFRRMLAGGISFPPSQFEALFLSAAHTDKDLLETIQAAVRAIAETA